MEASSLVLMERVNDILENELGSYEIENGIDLVYKAYVEDRIVHLFLTTDYDVDDDEYNEIFDNYNMDEIASMGYDVTEVDEEYNPMWRVSFEFQENHSLIQEALNKIIGYHLSEINRIKGILK